MAMNQEDAKDLAALLRTLADIVEDGKVSIMELVELYAEVKEMRS